MIFYFLFIIGSVSWLGLILAELGVFSITALLLIFILSSILGFRHLMPETCTGVKKSFSLDRSDSAFLLLMAVCALIYFRPHEYIGGRWDPGTYMNTGFHIAHEGKIVIEDPLFRQMSPSDMELFSRLKPGTVRYPGFYLKESHVGTLVPQFYYLFPLWIAVFFKCFGAYGSLFVNPVFALLSLWTLRRYVEELFDSKTALITCLFLGLAIPQIWNARFPTSEILTQYFILSGLYTYYRFEKNGRPVMGFLSGMSFSLALLARPTAILLLPALALYMVCRNWVQFTKKDFIPLGVLGLGLVHLYFQGQFWTKYYVNSLPSFFSSDEKFYYGIAAGIILSFCILSIFFRKQFQTFSEKTGVRQFFHLLLPGFLWGLALYAYLIRPQQGTSQELVNMESLSWFLGQPWTWMAVLGAVFWSHRHLKKENFLLFLLVLFELIFFLYKKRTFSSYPWALKRFTPIAIPGLAVFGAYFVTHVLAKSRLKNVLAVFLCILAVLWPLKRGKIFISLTDNQGLVSFMTRLNDQLDPSGIYFLDRDWLAVPLKHLYKKQILVLPEGYKFPKLENMFLEWLREGKKLYYIGFHEKPFSEKLNFDLLKKDLPVLETQALESSFGSYPERIKPVKIHPQIYQIKSLEQDNDDTLSKEILIQIGQNGIGLLEGFDKPRRFRDGTAFYRWTRGSAAIKFEKLFSGREFSIQLKLKNPKPASTGNTHVRIFINDNMLKELMIPPLNHFEKYVIPVKFSASESFQSMRIESSIWNPVKEGFSGDARDLGIILDDVQVLDSQDNILSFVDIGNEQNAQIEGFHKAEENKESFFAGRWTTGKARLILPAFKPAGEKVDLVIRIAGCQTRTEIKNRADFRKDSASKEMDKTEAPEKTPWLSLLIDEKPIVTKEMIPEKLTVLRFSIPSSVFKDKRHCVLTVESNAWKPSDYAIKSFPFKLGVLLDWIKLEEPEKQ